MPFMHLPIFHLHSQKFLKKDLNIKLTNQPDMAETITIPKEEYEDLLEEVGILRNKGMMDAIMESDKAREKGIKTWELKIHK